VTECEELGNVAHDADPFGLGASPLAAADSDRVSIDGRPDSEWRRSPRAGKLRARPHATASLGPGQHLSAAGSAVQSGRANTKRWLLEFEPTSPPEIEPLMGWLASSDTQKQVRLVFPTRESAVAFADRHGWDYTVYTLRERRVSPKSYAAQFTLGIPGAAS
jgi:ETC complex I subunit conserved region